MEMKNNRPEQQSRYLQLVKQKLVCDRKTKAKMLGDLENNLTEFCESHPQADWNEIIAHFGTPDSIAEDFAAEWGADSVKRVKINRRIGIAILVVVAALLLVFGTLTAIIAANNSRNSAYYYDETVSAFRPEE